MNLTTERKLVWNFPVRGLRYLREGQPPEGAALVAYTTDSENYFVRQWWLWPFPGSHVDGVESPLPQPACRLVNPATIALGVSAYNFIPDNARLPAKPTRLAERWTDYHNSRPRVVHFESLLQRLKRFLS